jgi:hypothetical protein
MKRLLETDDVAATVTIAVDAMMEKAGKLLTKDQVRKLYETQKELFKTGHLVDAKMLEKSLKQETNEKT